MWHFYSALRLMHKSHWPAFERGKALSRPPFRLEKGTGNTPQHGGHCCYPFTATQRDEDAERRHRSPGLSKPRYLGTDKEKKNYFFLTIFLSHPFFSSVSLSAKQADRQALSMSEYCLYTWIYTHAHTHTHTHTHLQTGMCLNCHTFLSPCCCLWLYDNDNCINLLLIIGGKHHCLYIFTVQCSIRSSTLHIYFC